MINNGWVQIYCTVFSFRNMDKDYYQTLNVNRNAMPHEIAEGYRKLALRWNPQLTKDHPHTAQYHFDQVSQAFEVLSDPIKKAYYDRHGWKKLKEGLYSQGGLKGGYRFGNNAQQIYEEFFRGQSSLESALSRECEIKGSLFSHAYGALNHQDSNEIEDLVILVPCQLSQLYQGANIRVRYERQVLNPDGRTFSIAQTEKNIQILPGYGSQTVLRYKNEGNHTIGGKQSDLVCQLRQNPHDQYQRNGDDLIYTARITLADAIMCCPIEVPTLDNRKLRIGLDQIPGPHNLKEVLNEGMPVKNSQKNTKGNLYIRFDICFPRELSESVREELRKLLS